MTRKILIRCLLFVLFMGVGYRDQAVWCESLKKSFGAAEQNSVNLYLEVPGAIKNMYHPKRMPDLYVVYKPYCLVTSQANYNKIQEGDPTATLADHGSMWNYDTSVPLIFFGKGIRRGRLEGKANLIDIAPTLASLLGSQPPASSTGRVLREAINPFVSRWGSKDVPRVAIVFTLDQCRQDYFTRFADALDYTKKEIIRKGTVFADTKICYAKTATAVSHTAIGTGTIPGMTGILGNNLYDPDTDEFPLSFDDSAHGEMSPENLLVPTLADVLDQLYHNQSKIVSLSCYGRAAMGLAGHGAYIGGGDKDIVLALNSFSGLPYTNSDWYTLPDYMKVGYNPDLKIDAWIKKYYGIDINTEQWTESTTVVDTGPFSLGEKRIPAPDGFFPWGEAFSFSHSMIDSQCDYPGDLQLYQGDEATSKYFEPSNYAPFYQLWAVDQMLEIMKQENVGQDWVPDMVFFNFKCLDKVGHRFGTSSGEMYTYFYYVDYCLKKIKTWLDANVGRNEYVMVITSDHGANDVIAGGEWIIKEDLVALIEKKFGKGIIKKFMGDQIFLDKGLLETYGYTDADVGLWMRENLDYLVNVYTKSEIEKVRGQ